MCVYIYIYYLPSPSSSIGHNDSIVNGESIVGQSGNVPCSNLDGFPQCLGHGEVQGTGDLQRLALFDPLRGAVATVCRREGTEI